MGTHITSLYCLTYADNSWLSGAHSLRVLADPNLGHPELWNGGLTKDYSWTTVSQRQRLSPSRNSRCYSAQPTSLGFPDVSPS